MDPAVNFETDVVDVERESDMPYVESMLMAQVIAYLSALSKDSWS